MEVSCGTSLRLHVVSHFLCMHRDKKLSTFVCTVQTVNDTNTPVIVLDNGSVLDLPVAGHHVITLALGDIVDLVIINDPSNSFNGDLT